MASVAIARVDEIPRLGARVLDTGGIRIAVFRTGDDRIFALEDRCPHRGGPLSQGIVHGHCVTCPLHEWVIDLATGEATGADEGSTTAVPVRVVDGRVYVDPDAIAACAVDSDVAGTPDVADAGVGSPAAAAGE